MSGRLDGGRHEWLGYLQPTGLVVAPAALARLGLWPEPQGPLEGAAAAAALEVLAAGEAWPLFRDVLGWTPERVAGALGGPPVPAALAVSLRDGETLLSPDWAVLSPAGDAVQLLVGVMPGVPLDRRGALDGWEATAAQRFERLLRETGVAAGVLVGATEAGRGEADRGEARPVLRLVTAPRGEAAGWLEWPLLALTQVSGRGMLAGLKLLLDGHALFTGAPSHRLPAMLAQSRAAQAEVSAKLAGQVLASLHELLRGLDAAAPDLIRELAARDPQQLYEGLLTVLLRLIFILYAEDRGLMPSATGGGAASLYEQGYALGGLHARLAEDGAREPDTADERRGAWGRLLALFRLVERGGADGFMQARGGQLFAEGRFPFLLGRRDPADPERVLPVGDGCVLRVLDGLLVQAGERVAYRSLSVEQIGSVYETVMGFTVQRAAGPTLAIRAGKGNRVPVWVDLTALAGCAPADRVRWLKDETGRGQFPAAVTRALREAADVPALAAALAPVVDARACPRGSPVGAGTPILQPTDERRRTGSHYTPRSLTEPIVTHALEAALARIGADATPAEVLALKVCDPAAGSGAFLVEACRQLAARLVAAWERWPAQRPTIPADEDALFHAKRLVAQHCLRGVDRNPLALDLAKLSLWLETLASAHEFTFLDHVLKCGDSLVGLPNPRIMAVSWAPAGAQHGFVETIVQQGIRAAGELDRLMRAEAEIASYAVQEGRHREATVAKRRAQLVADAVIAAFFAGRTARERDRALGEAQGLVLAPSAASWAGLEAMGDALRAGPHGIAPFHWELEFNDVFARGNPGFDAIVGNPPFAGKNTIAAGHPPAYPDWLKALHPGSHGNADIVAHFYRRAFGLLRRGGTMALIATNTIRQGDTRESGLARIVAEGGIITRAVSRHPWEGEAAVVVAQVFVSKGEASGGASSPAMLDGRPVRRISAHLVEGDLDGSPVRLRANLGIGFEGSKIYGAGFTSSDGALPAGWASTFSEMDDLIRRNPRNAALIKPYLGGEELNNSPILTHCRFAIDFRSRPLRRSESGPCWSGLSAAERSEQLRSGIVAPDYPDEVAADWPDLIHIVEQRVKPERDKVGNPATRNRWWLYERERPELYAAIAKLDRVLVCASTSPHLSLAFVDAAQVFAHSVKVFVLPSHAAFAVLQSRVHEVWARFFASTLEDRLRYTPSDCFETFPLPPGFDDDPALEAAGRAYHDARAALMIARGEGMTPTYNRFHCRADDAADIAALRMRHDAIDRAVLAAYGWDDLVERAAPVFLGEEDEDDHRYRGRLFWPAAFRDEVLARLLGLNGERGQAERVA